MFKIRPRLAALALALSAGVAGAHDFFLLPATSDVDGARPVALLATVASRFPTPEIVVPADRTERLAAFGPGRPQLQVAGAGDKGLRLEVVGAQAGMLVTTAGIKPRDVDYAEDRIPLILGEYRVLPAAAAAVEALPRPRSWQVVSRRYAKSLLCVADCKDLSAAARATDAHLEFISMRGAAGPFVLLGDGQPLANYPVDLVDKDGKRLHLATDGRGAIELDGTQRGMLMLFAARLQPPAGGGRFLLDLTSLVLSRP